MRFIFNVVCVFSGVIKYLYFILFPWICTFAINRVVLFIQIDKLDWGEAAWHTEKVKHTDICFNLVRICLLIWIYQRNVKHKGLMPSEILNYSVTTYLNDQ